MSKMTTRILLLILLLSGLTASTSAQIQTIEATDSLAQRRAKENANFTFLYSVVQGATHANITLLNLLPGSLGASGSFLRSNGSMVVFSTDGSALTNIPAASLTGTIAVERLPLFVGSGTNHAPGIVPDPGATPGTTRFLREDGTWAVLAGSGTVTSVGLNLPGEFNISGSPVTTNGTLTGAWASQAANKVFAAPDGSSGTPVFRLLVATDIPALAASKITSGSFGVPRGGIGITTVAANKILYASALDTIAELTPANSVIINSGNLQLSGDSGSPGNSKYYGTNGSGTKGFYDLPSTSGITSLNSQTGATQTFATGTSGTNFGISSSGNTHTFNLPDASASNRGVVTTGSQTFAGNKTFNGNVTIGSGGAAIATVLTASASLDFPSVNAGGNSTLTVSVTGANAGDAVIVTPPDGFSVATVSFIGWATFNTAHVRFLNASAGAIDLDAMTFRIVVIKMQ